MRQSEYMRRQGRGENDQERSGWMERYDIAVIGSGPGGISAAITSKIRNKSLLLFGTGELSEKVQKAELIRNYPGLPDISGKELAGQFHRQMEILEIPLTRERVNAVYAMGDYFAIQASGNLYEARSVILAFGMAQKKALKGEQEFLGRGVSYCATCDAALYRGKRTAVIGYTKEAEEEARFLSEMAEQVLYFPMYERIPDLPDNIQVLRENPREITGERTVQELWTEEGRHQVDGVFVLRESIAPEQLVPGLKIEDGHVAVNLKMETNLPGCFACGDLTGKPYQYIKAAGQGNVAALSAVEYLAKQRAALREK